jgi:hypothetical protein
MPIVLKYEMVDEVIAVRWKRQSHNVLARLLPVTA